MVLTIKAKKMDVQETVEARLTDEDVRRAVAQYASAYRAGDFVFDAETVRFGHEIAQNGEISITALVRTK